MRRISDLRITDLGGRSARVLLAVRRPFRALGLIGACVPRALPVGWYETGPLARLAGWGRFFGNKCGIDNIPIKNILWSNMWQVEPTTGWEKDQKHYSKKRPNELAAVMRNLDRYLKLLNVSKNAKAAQAGYLHPEQSGVLAIDQKGGGGSLQETRLYTYADDDTKTVYLIAIGDKDAQHADVEYCKDFVNTLRNRTDIQ